jgi:hypothetical protein
MIDYSIRQIPPSDAKAYIRKYHYSHTCINAPTKCYGLFEPSGAEWFGEEAGFIGVCMFATPCSENVRSSVFGAEYKDHVIELHRLHILDCTPPHTETWFIARCLKRLKEDMPEIWAVISFSDLTEGHTGVIYRAANAYRLGSTGEAKFFMDGFGRLRHPHQNGENITLAKAEKKGWKIVTRKAKNRFLWLLPADRRDKKRLIKLSKFDLSHEIPGITYMEGESL